VTIFVSIASYRDAELLPTLRDALATAARPDELRFGICWQHDENENLAEFAGDPRFRVTDVDYRESRGACWARALVMELYGGEDYFLQLDSHHRFADGWDEKLIGHFHRAGSEKPVLSTYLPNYEPDGERDVGGQPSSLEFFHYGPGGVPLLRGGRIPEGTPLDRPVPGKFLSGHFLFAPGSFVADVPYDPELYFHGEEITLSVRAWTHGYDIFMPPENLIWHYYQRPTSQRHWNDHVWEERDRASKRRVRRLLRGQETGRFGAGPVRTVAAYEEFTGLSFATLTVQRTPVQPLPALPQPALRSG
jgi:GT2 family glycosyltransferase